MPQDIICIFNNKLSLSMKVKHLFIFEIRHFSTRLTPMADAKKTSDPLLYNYTNIRKNKGKYMHTCIYLVTYKVNTCIHASIWSLIR